MKSALHQYENEQRKRERVQLMEVLVCLPDQPIEVDGEKTRLHTYVRELVKQLNIEINN